MDPSIIADLPEETRNAIEANFASYAAGLIKAQEEDRAANREEQARRDREREQAQENKPRSSTVQSTEQFPQDYARAQQQGWAAAPPSGTFRISSSSSPKVLEWYFQERGGGTADSYGV